PEGSWGPADDGHVAGLTALAGLTLLECGVPAKDLTVQKAARVIRAKADKLDFTYDLGLSILFLDRFGDPQDRQLIQVFALRLIAGQTSTGGWSYKCPILPKSIHDQLFSVLKQLDAQELREMENSAGLALVSPVTFGSFQAPAEKPQPGDKTPPKPAKVVIPEVLLRSCPVLRDPDKVKLEDPKDKSDQPTE